MWMWLPVPENFLGRLATMKTANAAAGTEHQESRSDSEDLGLVAEKFMTSHSKRKNWIVDSGATCHMSNDMSS